MDRLQKWIVLTFSLMVCLADLGFSYAIIEGPQNLTVVVGSTAQFNCTVSDGWKILIWLFNGNPKLSVLSSGTAIVTDSRYSQTGYNASGNRFTSELMIQNVQLYDSGQIKCSLQNNDDNKSAFLTVKESDDEDWRILTIILAVVLSVVSLVLLILIIVLIVCCCKRRKESNYHKEMRKVSENKKTERNMETVDYGGKENYGYRPEPTIGVPTFFTVNRNFYNPMQDWEISPPTEAPKNGHQVEELPSRTTDYPVNPGKIRNVTHV